ncbi:MAG: photosystem reaction center subunit [Caballeronia sp.]|jgi:ribosomal 30S subunit maturation factor RimM|nr:photosystem reaction center subunit [Caballeronia sp.]
MRSVSASYVEQLVWSIVVLRARVICEGLALDSRLFSRSIDALITQIERAFLLHRVVLPRRRYWHGRNSERLTMKKVTGFVTAAVLAMSVNIQALRAQGTPQAITQQRVDVVQLGTGYRASKINGSPVFDRNNERLGTIDDLIVVPGNKDAYVILSVGGFLGMGKHLVAIPFSELRIVGKEMQLPDATKDALKSLPEFKYTPN